MSRFAKPSRRTLATSIALLSLLPAAGIAQGPAASRAIDEPADAVARSQARVSVVEASGLLVRVWRAATPGRSVAERFAPSRFAPEPSTESATMEAATLFEFGSELAADRGRLHHGGNLLRIDF